MLSRPYLNVCFRDLADIREVAIERQIPTPESVVRHGRVSCPLAEQS